jgi:16S rRNA processing protein RimM
MSAPEPAWPADAVEVGVVIGAWGIRGAIKVKPHAADPQALLGSRHWFLGASEGPAASQAPQHCGVVQARVHADGIVAQLREVPDRSAAEGLKGVRIFVSRAEFPKTTSDEFYWVDLIGLAVVNREGEPLGSVSGLIDTGAHSVLRVATGDEDERLIPFVDAYVDSVDLAARRIVVDWGLDY